MGSNKMQKIFGTFALPEVIFSVRIWKECKEIFNWFEFKKESRV